MSQSDHDLPFRGSGGGGGEGGAVTSVDTRVGDVLLTDRYIQMNKAGVPSGVATLDATGVLKTAQVPPGFEGPEGPAGPPGPAGASSGMYEYTLSTSITVPPTAGQARTDTTTAPTATHLYLSHQAATGVAVAPLLRNITVGDTLVVQDKTVTADSVTFVAAGDAVDFPAQAYVEVPIAYVDGTLTEGKNNQRILVFHTMVGEPGLQGEPGEGVPFGGDPGQLLAKVTADDFDTAWVDPPAGGGGGGTMARATATATATAVASAAEKRVTIELAPAYQILGLSTSVPARVRLYPSDGAAAADLPRPIDLEPSATAEIIMEFVTTSSFLSATVSPSVGGASIPPSATAYLTLGNLSTSAGDVTVTVTYLPLEG